MKVPSSLRPTRLFQRFRWVLFGGFITVALVSLIYATTPLVTPSWTAPGPVAATTTPCAGALVGPANTLTPGSGTARFNCGTSGSTALAAFTVSTAGSDTPTFTLQPGETGLGYVSHGAADCSSQTLLTSGTATTLSVGSWDLCIDYTVTATTSFSSTTLNWSS